MDQNAQAEGQDLPGTVDAEPATEAQEASPESTKKASTPASRKRPRAQEAKTDEGFRDRQRNILGMKGKW